jgi:hypothetical protein
MDISCWQRGCDQREWFTACAVWRKRFHATLIYTPIGLMIRYLVWFADNPNCSVRGLGRSETRALASKCWNCAVEPLLGWTAGWIGDPNTQSRKRISFRIGRVTGTQGTRNILPFIPAVEAYAASRCPLFDMLPGFLCDIQQLGDLNRDHRSG